MLAMLAIQKRTFCADTESQYGRQTLMYRMVAVRTEVIDSLLTYAPFLLLLERFSFGGGEEKDITGNVLIIIIIVLGNE